MDWYACWQGAIVKKTDYKHDSYNHQAGYVSFDPHGLILTKNLNDVLSCVFENTCVNRVVDVLPFSSLQYQIRSL